MGSAVLIAKVRSPTTPVFSAGGGGRLGPLRRAQAVCEHHRRKPRERFAPRVGEADPTSVLDPVSRPRPSIPPRTTPSPQETVRLGKFVRTRPRSDGQQAGTSPTQIRRGYVEYPQRHTVTEMVNMMTPAGPTGRRHIIESLGDARAALEIGVVMKIGGGGYASRGEPRCSSGGRRQIEPGRIVAATSGSVASLARQTQQTERRGSEPSIRRDDSPRATAPAKPKKTAALSCRKVRRPTAR